jgi:germacradienol/geosmin synthase
MQYKLGRDRHGARLFTDQLHALLSGDGSESTYGPRNAVEKGLVNLLSRLQAATPPVRRRYIDAIGRYIEGGVWELDNICDNRLPGLIEYIERRRETFFSYGILNYIDTATGTEIPERIRRTQPIIELLKAIMDHWALENDIVSYHGEIHQEHEINNVVLILEDLLDLNTQDAMRTVAAVLRQRFTIIEHIIDTQLPRLADRAQLTTDERADLTTWIHGARSGLAGTHAWHTHAARYVEHTR